MIRYFVILACFCLVACGGGGGAGVDAPPAPFAAQLAAARDQQVSFLAALPSTGTADYRGQIRLDLPLGDRPAAEYLGALAVQVAFDAGTTALSGQVSQISGPGGALTGDLRIADGTTFPGAHPLRDYQFSAGLSGAVAQQGQSYDLRAMISGDFVGTAGAEIVGVVHQGAITQGDQVDIFDGAFVAQRIPSPG